MMIPSLSHEVEVTAEAEPPVQLQDRAVLLAVTKWRAAEGRLYPLIMVDPELYEGAVGLVCEAADELRRRCRTVGELLAVDASAVLATCPAAAAMTALGFDSSTAFAAACAKRWRELTAAEPDAGSDASRDGQR